MMKIGTIKLIFKNRTHCLVATVAVASLIWLTSALPFLALYQGGVRPFFTPGIGFPDLAHYYMGGSIVLEGDYDSLYPTPSKNEKGNMGLVVCSIPKPGYAQLAEQKGVEDSLRYILPPPTAFLFAPYAAIPYPIARWVWVCVMGFFLWLSCFLSYRIALGCGVSPLVATGGWFVMAFSPLVNNATRIANCTPVLAVALGLAAIGIYKNKTLLTVSMCIVAGLLKGTSIIFAPLILLMRRYSVIVWGLAVVLLINAITLLIMGRQVYEEFLTVIYPSTRLVVTEEYNRAVFACLYRTIGEPALTGAIPFIVKTTGLALGTWLCILIWKLRCAISENYSLFNSSVIGLLGLYIIFSPYAWLHYALCFFPFLPALWGSLNSRWSKGLMAVSFAAMWLPPGMRINVISPYLPEPLASHFLLGQIGIIALAFSVLIRGAKNLRQTSAQ